MIADNDQFAASRSGRSQSVPIVELENVVCLINGFPALAGLSLQVNESEIVLIKGPNGAGKTTLLRLLAGLIAVRRGSASVLGHDLSVRSQRRSLRRETGLLGHETFLYNDLTVEQNLKFWVDAGRIDPAGIEPILTRLSLDGRLKNVRVGQLSAGQRRRTALAVLVSRRPRLWLLDEPHAGLDQSGKDFVDDLITTAVKYRTTIVVASHDLEIAERLAHRTVRIAGGQTVGFGTAGGDRGPTTAQPVANVPPSPFLVRPEANVERGQ